MANDSETRRSAAIMGSGFSAFRYSLRGTMFASYLLTRLEEERK